MQDHPDQARVHAALQRVWRQVEPEIQRRLTTLEEAGKALQAGPMDEGCRHEAIDAAHKLAGSLGMFGFAAASAWASEIESLLEIPGAISGEQFNGFMERLRVEVNRDRNEQAGGSDEGSDE